MKTIAKIVVKASELHENGFLKPKLECLSKHMVLGSWFGWNVCITRAVPEPRPAPSEEEQDEMEELAVANGIPLTKEDREWLKVPKES